MNNEIIKLTNTLINKDGLHQTFIKDIAIYKTMKAVPRAPLIYDLCLIIVLQGEKIGYLGENIFNYNSQNYLVVPTTIPFECETIASADEPFICLLITIDKKIMYEIIDLIANKDALNSKSKTSQLGIFSDNVTPQIEDTILRVLQTLSSKEESRILGESLLKELYYRIASGENSYFLHKMFLNTKIEAKIARSLRVMHENYNEHLDIPTLAREEDMSTSSFHTHFKKITTLTPLQYIKKIRLNKAHKLLAQQSFQVNDTAFAIGYESSSQFSRDFKSFFGYPPKEAKPSFEEYLIV